MKNERYLADAVAELRQNKHLPERVLALSDDDIVAITQSVYNVANELADKRSSDIVLDFEDGELLEMFRAAHELNITFTEFVEKALVDAIARAHKP